MPIIAPTPPSNSHSKSYTERIKLQSIQSYPSITTSTNNKTNTSMYHRQPNPDLPAIREEDDDEASISSTPTPSASNTPVEQVDDDDIETSSAISYANSYAFTLDNVGLDEENSLVGSVVGSVIGLQATRSRDSLVHTPPSQVTPERISRHERKLHRETCRTLGLPYSYDTLTDSSPSSGSEDAESMNKSIGNSLLNCGASVHSGSSDGGAGNGDTKNGKDEKERKRKKIDKLWPWPTASIKSFKDKQQTSSCIESTTDSDRPLDQMRNNVNQDVKSSSGSGTKLINAAKLSDSASTYTDRMKEAFASFSERIEVAYQAANPDRPQQQNRETAAGNQQTDEPPSTSSGDEENTVTPARNKRPKTVQDLFQPGWVQSYKQSYHQTNPMTKLTVSATVLFMLICSIALLAMVSVSQSDAQSGNGGNLAQDGVDVTTHHDLDGLLDVVGAGSTGDAATDTAEVVVAVNTAKPTVMPSQKPTASPFKMEITLPDYENVLPEDDTHEEASTEDDANQDAKDISDKEGNDVLKDDSSQVDSKEDEEPSCLNMEGKFNSSQGKSRKCHWLTNADPGALVSSRLKTECGGLPGQLSSIPSELGLNCRHACRAYNGCLTSEEASAAVVDYLGKNEDDAAKVDRVASRDEGIEGESIAKVQFAPESTNAPTPSPVTSSPTLEPSNEATSPFPTTSEPTNRPTGSPIEVEPQQSEETELDLSISKFTDIRGRDRQCWWLDIRNRNQRMIRRNANCVRADVQAVCPSSCRSYMTMAVMNHNALGHVLNSNNNSNKDDIAPLISSSPLIQLNSATIATITTVDEQEDACSDEVGFFVNNHGQVRQCSWLINDRDPTDETRRMTNCGYGGNIEATDLGRMCMSTCGTC